MSAKQQLASSATARIMQALRAIGGTPRSRQELEQIIHDGITALPNICSIVKRSETVAMGGFIAELNKILEAQFSITLEQHDFRILTSVPIEEFLRNPQPRTNILNQEVDKLFGRKNSNGATIEEAPTKVLNSLECHHYRILEFDFFEPILVRSPKALAIAKKARLNPILGMHPLCAFGGATHVRAVHVDGSLIEGVALTHTTDMFCRSTGYHIAKCKAQVMHQEKHKHQLEPAAAH